MSASFRTFRATYALGMPQMLFGGVSERWIFKEAGDIHWRMLCDDLGARSVDLKDDQGERLYASFMRVRLESTAPLNTFAENDELTVSSSLSRFGDKRFFSETTFTGTAGEIRMEMASVFLTRSTDNKSLARATPLQLAQAKSVSHPVVPVFGQGYQALKRTAFDGPASPQETVLQLGGLPFDWQETTSKQRTYVVDPYYDFNGANLLYFASYPRIHDVCERQVLSERALQSGHAVDLAFGVSPLARDVYYFGNADAGDALEFSLKKVEFVQPDRLRIWSTLVRTKDGARIADVFTVKALTDPALKSIFS